LDLTEPVQPEARQTCLEGNCHHVTPQVRQNSHEITWSLFAAGGAVKSCKDDRHLTQ
jgi:hypothetical protein